MALSTRFQVDAGFNVWLAKRCLAVSPSLIWIGAIHSIWFDYSSSPPSSSPSSLSGWIPMISLSTMVFLVICCWVCYFSRFCCSLLKMWFDAAPTISLCDRTAIVGTLAWNSAWSIGMRWPIIFDTPAHSLCWHPEISHSKKLPEYSNLYHCS